MIDIIRKQNNDTLELDDLLQDEDSQIERQVLEDYVFKQYVIII